MSPSAQDLARHTEQHAEDLRLAQAAVAGDESARRQVARRLHDRVLVTVRYLCAGRSDTLDLVQSCLVELLRALAAFRGESLLETWADRIAARTAMRELVRDGKRRELSTEVARAPANSGEDPEQLLGRGRLLEQVAASLQRLTPRRRLVLVMRAVHGYTMPEIAALADLRLHDVQNDYRAARKQLRRLVQTDPLLREWARGRRP